MSGKHSRLVDVLHTRCAPNRAYKPCVRVPQKLKRTLQGTLNVVVVPRTGVKQPCALSFVDESIAGTYEHMSESEDELMHDIARECQLLHRMVADSHTEAEAQDVDARAHITIDTQFDMSGVHTPRQRVSKRDIEWCACVHDIYAPEYSSESEEGERSDRQRIFATMSRESYGSHNTAQRKTCALQPRSRRQIRLVNFSRPEFRTSEAVHKTSTAPRTSATKHRLHDFSKKRSTNCVSSKHTRIQPFYAPKPNEVLVTALGARCARLTHINPTDKSEYIQRRIRSIKRALMPVRGMSSREEHNKSGGARMSHVPTRPSTGVSSGKPKLDMRSAFANNRHKPTLALL